MRAPCINCQSQKLLDETFSLMASIMGSTYTDVGAAHEWSRLRRRRAELKL